VTNSRPRTGKVMTATGGLMLLAAVLFLFLVDDPFPMWLLIGGAGVMFIGVGSALQRQNAEGNRH